MYLTFPQLQDVYKMIYTLIYLLEIMALHNVGARLSIEIKNREENVEVKTSLAAVDDTFFQVFTSIGRLYNCNFLFRFKI